MKINAKFPKLKVFHFISGDLWAGAETMAYNLLSRLKEYDDLEVSVILLNEGRLAVELRDAGLKVYVVDESQHSFWNIFRKIQVILARNPPDIVHSHRYKENLLAFLTTRFYRRIKLISTQHGLPEMHINKPDTIQRLISSTNFLGLSRFFHTVAVSEDIRTALVNRFRFSVDRVGVIHNGIQLPDSVFSKTGSVPFVIGSSGRLFPIKDYPLMVEIAQTVAAVSAEVIHFELAGDGPGRIGLEELVKNYDLNDRFTFRGHVDDMHPFYRNLDIYLNTSLHEGIPMTILEALSHGLPVIAPAVGGIVEIIDDGIDGFLIDSRNPLDFADKCLLLKENRELLAKMKQAARKKAERIFSAEMMAERYYRLYRRLAD